MTAELAVTLSDEEKKARFSNAEEILKNAGADYVIRTIRELPKVIEEINQRLENEES